MPAIMTHDFFGKDVYAAHADLIGTSQSERDAFLLGNQGPDPLFYLVLTLRMRPFFALGSTMHHRNPSKLLDALKESLDVLEENEVATGRAYAAGFLCHYTLDSSMHPLVYQQQFSLCDAGVEGLTRADGNEVHAEIEREFDEMVLYTKLGRTISSYKPYQEVLRASDETLAVIGKMYAFFCMKALHEFVPVDMFPTAVKNFRTTQKFFYSPRNAKHALANTVETRMLRRNYSFYKSMAHRDNATLTSDFDNRVHQRWENPFTHESRTDGFWDIFDAAQSLASRNIETFFEDDFDLAAARRITEGLDFSGEPVEGIDTTTGATTSSVIEDGAAQLAARATDNEGDEANA
ncbi:MAG: peptidase [Slackia sp.]|nr:peptidase [Slackia sp.]